MSISLATKGFIKEFKVGAVIVENRIVQTIREIKVRPQKRKIKGLAFLRIKTVAVSRLNKIE